MVGRGGREARQRPFTGTFAEPEPAAVVAVFEPYEVEVPYSNHQSVATLPGLTVPVSVAVVPPTALTGPVRAVGAAAAAVSANVAARTAEAARARAAVPEAAHERGRYAAEVSGCRGDVSGA